MTDLQQAHLIGTAFLALGFWLLLPGSRSRRLHFLGGGFLAAGFGLLAAQLPFFGEIGPQAILSILSGATVIGAVAMISVRNPVYSAIWFAVSLLGTAGILLFAGAQFLGVATIVVYAGAILVTFLFVLMLAQPGGHSFYDAISWEGRLSSVAAALTIGVISYCVADSLPHPPTVPQAQFADRVVLPVKHSAKHPGHGDAEISAAEDSTRESGVLADQHMARMGGELFSRHLIAVELAGTLLMVALVGAIAIAGQRTGGGSSQTPSTGESRHG